MLPSGLTVRAPMYWSEVLPPKEISMVAAFSLPPGPAGNALPRPRPFR